MFGSSIPPGCAPVFVLVRMQYSQYDEVAMKAQVLYTFLQAEFGNELQTKLRKDGRAFFWTAMKDESGSKRLIRISETSAGNVAEIKLAQSSLAAGENVFLPLPASNQEVADAVRRELSGPHGS